MPKKITRRKWSPSLEKYRFVVEHAQEAVVVVQEGRIKFFNPKAVELLGYTAGEFLKNEFAQRPFIEFVHPNDQALELERYHRLLRGDLAPEIYNLRIIDRNGNIRWVEISAVLIDWEDKAAALNFLNDITYRKKVEEHNVRLETAIEQAAECVIITDFNGIIQFVNPAFERISGYARGEVIGQTPGILKSGKHDRAFYTSMWNILTSGKVWRGHLVNMKKDGSLYEEDATISPVKNSMGEITNYVAVKRDVTEDMRQKRQLRQAQKMEAIGTLAGGIAHDFNNILAAIIGYSEIAMEKVPADASLQNNLQEIFAAGRRARNLVRQILAFSRQSEQELHPIQIKLIVKEALKLLRASLPTTIEIRQNIQSDEAVLADPTQIHQILMNLCTNAAHAMREKGGILEIGLTNIRLDIDFTAKHQDLIPGPYQRLTVSDTGHGMSSEVKEKIFDPFFTTKEKEEGTGMGLAVVHGIVKSHGGIISVYSEEGKGSTFHVYLPAVKLEAKGKIEIKGPLPTGDERILFVDDEKPLVDIGKQMLERQGYEVTIRTSSIEALELFKARPDKFDLIITDQTMPNMTGKELAKELIQIRPDIPIILCTGFSEAITEETAKALGIRAFLLKPLALYDLARTIRKVLNDK